MRHLFESDGRHVASVNMLHGNEATLFENDEIAFEVENDIEYTLPIKLVDDSIIYDESSAAILKHRLVSVCDDRQEAIKGLILEEKNTAGQIERYKLKAELAANGEWGSDEENAAIMVENAAFKTGIAGFVKLIEVARQGITAMIEAGSYERAEAKIEAAKSFDTSMDAEKLQAFLAS